jgi:FAD dependent oxidoreductase TIGR03364
MSKTAIIVGAGIAGLATARALAVRNYDVTVLERSDRAIGASIRNFGMVWPVGQPDGKLYERAMLTRSVWMDICKETGLWCDPVGSLHLAYTKEEWDVLEELASVYTDRGIQLSTPDKTLQRSSAIVSLQLKGSLFSPHELIVDPRQAIPVITEWLNKKYSVQFVWGKAVTDISYPSVYAGREEFEADEIYVCSGADFETLYPEKFASLPVTKCKLQMMRMAAQPGNWHIGPALCGGLSLLHYKSFQSASSLQILRKKLEQEYPDHLKWGIHVMVAQNQQGELTIGDSHEYGSTHDPFDKHFINQLILDYLQQFARFRNESIVQTWNGIYPKLTDGSTELVQEAEPGVWIINCFGGAGMTLGFGLCEQVVASNQLSVGSWQ